MADIVVTCVQCGNNITISEFVTAEAITCMKCKGQVPIPPREPAMPSAAGKIKLSIVKPPETAAPPPKKFDKKKTKEDRNVQQYLPQAGKKLIRARKVTTFEVKVLPWILFFVMLLIFGWMRYIPGALAPDIHPMFIEGGVWALLLLHFAVICLAFGDDSFCGILCVVVPGYSVYYLFTQADQMLLRGLAGALMIVFGLDFAIWAGSVWTDFYNAASNWIATTETVKRK